MAVRIQTEPSFAVGNPEVVIEGRYFAPFGTGRIGARTYDISPDGKHFLMVKDSTSADSTAFILVQNWFEELERLAPTGN